MTDKKEIEKIVTKVFKLCDDGDIVREVANECLFIVGAVKKPLGVTT